MSFHYSQSNLILPELDNDPAILKVKIFIYFFSYRIAFFSLQVIHDAERLERETYRKELLQILKIHPTNDETISTPAESQTDSEKRPNRNWTRRNVPLTPNSYSNSSRRQNNRSLNSSVDSFNNRSLMESPRSGFMKSAHSETNLSLSPLSMNKTSPIQTFGKTTTNKLSLTPAGTIVTDYRQSSAMKRIVNP